MQARTARITSKGQVTIPAEIRRFLGVAPLDKVSFLVEAGQVRVTAGTSVVERTAGMLKGEEAILQEEKTEAEVAIAEEAAGSGHLGDRRSGRRLRKAK